MANNLIMTPNKLIIIFIAEEETAFSIVEILEIY